MRSIIVGITGGSGSGKTTLAKKLVEYLGPDIVTRVPLDNYFFPNASTNNAPEAVDFSKVHAQLDALLRGEEVVTTRGNLLTPNEIYIVEGHLVMCDPDLVQRLNLSIYVDLDPEERLLRRIQRNVGFGMELQGIIDWFRKDVKHNFKRHVEPQKELCDLIVWGEITERRVEILAEMILRIKEIGRE